MKKAYVSLVAAILTPVVIMSIAFSTDLAKSIKEKALLADALVEASEFENMQDKSKRINFTQKLIKNYTDNDNLNINYTQTSSKSSLTSVTDNKNLIFGKLYDKEKVKLSYELNSMVNDKSFEANDYVFALSFAKSSNDAVLLDTTKICNEFTKNLINNGLCNPPAGKPYLIDAYQTLIAYIIKLAKQQDFNNSSYFGFIPFGAGVQVKGSDLKDVPGAIADATYVVWPIDFFNFGYENGFRNLDNFSAYYPLEFLGLEFLQSGVKSNEKFSIIPSLLATNNSKLANALKDDFLREFILSHFDIDKHKDLNGYKKAREILQLSFNNQEPLGIYSSKNKLSNKNDVLLNVASTLAAIKDNKDVLTYRLYNPKYDRVDLNIDPNQLRIKLLRKSELSNKLASIAAIKDMLHEIPEPELEPELNDDDLIGSGGYSDLVDEKKDEIRNQLDTCHYNTYEGGSFAKFCKLVLSDASTISKYKKFEPEAQGDSCWFNFADNDLFDMMANDAFSGIEAVQNAYSDCEYVKKFLPSSNASSVSALSDEIAKQAADSFSSSWAYVYDDDWNCPACRYEDGGDGGYKASSMGKWCLSVGGQARIDARATGDYEEGEFYIDSNAKECYVPNYDDGANSTHLINLMKDIYMGKENALAALKSAPEKIIKMLIDKGVLSSENASKINSSSLMPNASAADIAKNINWDDADNDRELDNCVEGYDNVKKGSKKGDLCYKLKDLDKDYDIWYDSNDDECYFMGGMIEIFKEKLKAGDSEFAEVIKECGNFKEFNNNSSNANSQILAPFTPQTPKKPSFDINSIKTEVENALYDCRYNDPDIYEGNYFYEFCINANNKDGAYAKYNNFSPIKDTYDGRNYCYFEKFEGLAETLLYDLKDEREYAKKVLSGCSGTKMILERYNINTQVRTYALASLNNAYINALKDYFSKQDSVELDTQIFEIQDKLDNDFVGKLAFNNCDGFNEEGETIKSDWSKEQCEMFRSYIDNYKANLEKLTNLKKLKEEEANNQAKIQPTLDLIDELASFGVNDFSSAANELERLYAEYNNELESINSELDGALSIKGMGLCNSFVTYVQGSSCQQTSAREMKFFETPLRKINSLSEIKEIPMINEPAFEIENNNSKLAYISNIGATHEHASIGLARAYKYLSTTASINKRAKIFLFTSGSNEASDEILIDAGMCKMIKDNLAAKNKETEIIVVGLGHERSKDAKRLVTLDKFKRIWDKCDAKVITADTVDELIKQLSAEIFDNRSRYYYE